MTTLFAAPVRVRGRALGVLCGDRGGAPFALSAEQLVLAQGLADHAALALEVARLGAELAALQSAPGPRTSCG